MIIHDLDLGWTLRSPYEEKPKLIIDTNTVLPDAISRKQLQAIPRGNAKILKAPGTVEHGKLSHCHALNIDEALHALPLKERIGLGASKGLDRHARILTEYGSIV